MCPNKKKKRTDRKRNSGKEMMTKCQSQEISNIRPTSTGARVVSEPYIDVYYRRCRSVKLKFS